MSVFFNCIFITAHAHNTREYKRTCLYWPEYETALTLRQPPHCFSKSLFENGIPTVFLKLILVLRGVIMFAFFHKQFVQVMENLVKEFVFALYTHTQTVLSGSIFLTLFFFFVILY